MGKMMCAGSQQALMLAFTCCLASERVLADCKDSCSQPLRMLEGCRSNGENGMEMVAVELACLIGATGKSARRVTCSRRMCP